MSHILKYIRVNKCFQVEAERNIVKQSTFAAEKTTPRKNRCTLSQGSRDLAIIKASSSFESCSDVPPNSSHDPFQEQAHEVGVESKAVIYSQFKCI